MQKIIKDRQIVEDRWQRVGAQEALPVGDVIVPWPRWKVEQESLLAHEGKVAIWLTGKDNPRELKEELGRFEMIAIDFPNFNDGRGYSIARILRDELGYMGELRALGDVLRDQIFYLARCGFNAFEVRKDKDLEEALAGLHDFHVMYQAASDRTKPIYRRFGGMGA